MTIKDLKNVQAAITVIDALAKLALGALVLEKDITDEEFEKAMGQYDLAKRKLAAMAVEEDVAAKERAALGETAEDKGGD